MLKVSFAVVAGRQVPMRALLFSTGGFRDAVTSLPCSLNVSGDAA